MASKALPNPNENSTDALLGQILGAIEKQSKDRENSDKVLFYGQALNTKNDEEHTKQLIETTGGKDKSKTIDEVADFAKEQTLSLKVQQELAEQEAKEKADEELFKETLTKFGELKEIIGTKFTEKVEQFVEGIYHNTQTGSEQFKKGVNKLKDGIGILGPLVNSVSTVFGKLRAGFDIFFGAGRAILSSAVATKKFFFGLSKKEQAEERLAEAEEEYRKAEEDLIRQQQLEGQPTKHLDPLPLPVTMEGFKGAVAEEEEKPRDEHGDIDGNVRPGATAEVKEVEDERSPALIAAEERKISAEMILAQQKETYERDYNKQRKKGLKGFFQQGKRGFKKFFTQLSLMSIAKFLMPIAGIALMIMALFTDLPNKLVDMADKAFGLNMPRYPEGHPREGEIMTEEDKAFAMDYAEARGLRNLSKVPANAFVQKGLAEAGVVKAYSNQVANKPNTKTTKALTSMKSFSKALGPAGTLISPFMIAADYGAQNADRLSSRAGVIEAFEAGVLFKPGPNGEPIPVTAKDMVLFQAMSEADASGDLAGTLGDYGISLGSAAVVSGAGLKLAGAVALAPVPGARIAAGVIALGSLFAGYKTAKALDDAGINEVTRAILDNTFDRRAFNRIIEEQGLDPAEVDYNEMRRQYEEMIRRAIQEDQEARFGDSDNKETASLNVPVIQQQYNMDSNFYGNGPMDNPFLGISVEKPMVG